MPVYAGRCLNRCDMLWPAQPAKPAREPAMIHRSVQRSQTSGQIITSVSATQHYSIVEALNDLNGSFFIKKWVQRCPHMSTWSVECKKTRLSQLPKIVVALFLFLHWHGQFVLNCCHDMACQVKPVVQVEVNHFAQEIPSSDGFFHFKGWNLSLKHDV